MTAVELLAQLQEKGIIVRADGDRLRLRPASALTLEDVEHLRAAKPELLALLSPAPPALDLDAATLREALGPRPGPAAVADLQAEVLAGLHQIEEEIRTGVLGSGVLLVRGRPLADWLSLDEVARLLRRVQWRKPAPGTESAP